MRIKAKDLEVGMSFHSLKYNYRPVVKVAHEIEVAKGGIIMVKVNPTTPFIDSAWDRFDSETDLEVV